MKLSANIFTRFTLAILITFSMVLVGFSSIILTAQKADAQSKPPRNLCIDRGSGVFYLLNDVKCPDNLVSARVSSAYGGVCKRLESDGYHAVIPDGASVSFNKTTGFCYENDDPSKTYDFVSFDSMPTVKDPGGSPPGPVPPTPNPSPNPNPSPTPNPGNTGGGQVQGHCTDPKFHEVGPLCVPNSPFTTGLVGDGNPTTFIIKIIRILLYFAGIVAIIMAIIGGYQYMTARGNDVQAANGRKTLTNALIGLAIVILSYIIVTAVINFVTK